MSHLDRDRLLLLVEQGQAPSTSEARHLSQCDQCRSDLEQVRAALDALRDVVVPEPSPLFWEHFASRVRRAIDETPQVPAARWTVPWWALGSLAAATLVALVLVLPGRSVVQPGPAGDGVASAVQGDAAPAEDAVGEDWSVVSDLAADLDYDEVTHLGGTLRPGAADVGVSALSDDERRELVRLLEEELRKARPS